MPHTPGPWYDDGYRIHAPTNDADKRNGRVIVEYKHVDDFNNPDACLIAAAPELLEACKYAAAELKRQAGFVTRNWKDEFGEDAVCGHAEAAKLAARMLEAAILKAEIPSFS